MNTKEILSMLSTMSPENFRELVNQETKNNLDLMLPVANALSNVPVRAATLWLLSIPMCMCSEIPVEERQVLAAILRKGAEFMETGPDGEAPTNKNN
jgi:hypothetical protein